MKMLKLLNFLIRCFCNLHSIRFSFIILITRPKDQYRSIKNYSKTIAILNLGRIGLRCIVALVYTNLLSLFR